MAPTVVGSEMAETPTQYLQRNMEEAFFPPLARTSKMALGSDIDMNDFRRDRLGHPRGSMPISAGSIKFPTIDRSKSTSVASLSGAHQSKNRSHRRSSTRDREIHGSFRRSPSCPSHIDYKRDFSNAGYFKSDSNLETEESMVSTADSSGDKGESVKLPSIFSTDSQNQNEKKKVRDVLAWKSDGYRERNNVLGLHEREPFLNNTSEYNSMGTSRDPHQKTQSQALLLPIKTDTGTNTRKKKKRHQKKHTKPREDNEYNTQLPFSPRGGCFNSEADAVLDVIARENARDEENALEPTSSRSVKQWIKANRSQKQGHVNS